MASDAELPWALVCTHSSDTYLGAEAPGSEEVPVGSQLGQLGRDGTRLLSTARFPLPQASVYCVAAVLWTAAKFGVPRDHKLALPRRLKTLLLEMARRSAQERPSVAEASKVAACGQARWSGQCPQGRGAGRGFQERPALGRGGVAFICGGPTVPALSPEQQASPDPALRPCRGEPSPPT